MPGPNDVAVVSKPTLLDVNARVAGVVVRAGGRLIFQPRRSRTLRSSGNVVVKGKLVMHPDSRKVSHRLVFVDVDESRFVGGGMEVLGSDVGLWVMNSGVVDLVGSVRRPWTRTVDGVDVGDSAVTLMHDPRGWRVGDELAITPTTPPTKDRHAEAFDVLRIAAIDGRRVTFSAPATFAHPEVRLADDRVLTPEVLNLTRNVRIEGTPRGRAHMFVHSTRPQTIRYAAMRYMGPRQKGTFVTGRYGIHFHHAQAGSRTTVVKGAVVRDAGSHSFVPHSSHGITFKRCIAFDVYESAFWWDVDELSNDIVWDSCVAAKVKSEQGSPGQYTLTGFSLQDGDNNVCRRCVATGIGGLISSSGYMWPSKGPNFAVWGFEDCVAHNNVADGIFAWQNDARDHVIRRFAAYHNGKTGIEHGAYRNLYRYFGVTLVGNGASGIWLHASSKASDSGSQLLFEGTVLDGGGVSPVSLFVTKHAVGSEYPSLFRSCIFKGYREVAVRVDDQKVEPGRQDFVRCEVGPSGRDLEPSDFDIVAMHESSLIRVQRQDNRTAYRIDHTGVATPIPPFAD